MGSKTVRRQRTRRALIIISFLLFPIIMNYLSPYVIIDGASQGIVTGSFIAFAGMFLSSLFLGRLWCGWACPAAGAQEIWFGVSDKPARGGWRDGIKWALWVVWIGGIALVAIQAGGYTRVDPLHLTDHGISVSQPMNYFTYYMVIAIFLILATVGGRRGACHTICWMAPFMILGRKLRNLFRWPSLLLAPETASCIKCGRCTTNCPMSLPVTEMVQRGDMENSECILCGSCVDTCPKDVIHYTFSGG